ncbi:hypothetical protein AB9E06_21585 [Rhizobium leguminosarum]|uniref:hypothetical protein n=1 Tax=Rhizobium leguminosarum TaxID=384 RepID=UPI003F9670F5
MTQTFLPPALLKDFDRSQHKDQLYADWHLDMDRIAGTGAARFPAAFSAIDPPAGSQPKQASPEWTGMPRTIKRIIGPSVAAAAKEIDEPRAFGAMDPVDMTAYQPFRDSEGKAYQGPLYRSQDEYLEWAVKRDPDGVIREVAFTCEGPEYWDRIASDENLLVELYRELCEDSSVALEDLVFDRDVTWVNPYSGGGSDQYQKGSYNRFNRWNAAHAVHLTHPANTLGAEITLALQATRPYGNPTLVISDPALVCCAGYGGVNRMSDPTIGSGVNTQVVQLKRRVALRNPIGLYIKGLQPNVFNLPDGSPFADQDACWTIIRPEPKDVTDMIVRARFRVPDGLTFQGKRLRVGDLRLHGENVVTGGQIADVITMTLYALAIPGAPAQKAVACSGSPCQDSAHPDFIHVIEFGSTCPPGGMSALQKSIVAAGASRHNGEWKGAMADGDDEGLHRYARVPRFRP